ncbi:MAG TPA: hypothetical protein EYP64_05770 [Desulfarculaceae bacterium]|nr:hypothetical protein [Desulfarculaceae bacterium]
MKLDRRNFIKLGAVSGGALALPNPMQVAKKNRAPWNRQQARNLRKFRNPKPTTCGLCENRCGLISYREGDHVVMLHGNSDHPVNRGKICARAYGQLDRLYDPDRVLAPKLRDGERGHGKWKTISWEKAYEIIAEKLTPYFEKQGDGLALVQGRKELLSDTLLEMFPKALAVEDGSNFKIEDLRLKLYGVTGCRRDFANSRYILNFAADPYLKGENLLSDMREILNGKLDNAARLVTVSARLNNTAGRGDGWIPLAPADYGTFARALAYQLIDADMYNKRALAEHGLQVAELKSLLRDYAPEKVSKEIGIEEGLIKKIAKAMVIRPQALAIYDDELLLAPDGRQSAAAVELLNLLLGAVGNPGGVYYFSEESALANVATSVNSQKERQRVTMDWFANWLTNSGNRPAVISYMANPAYTTFSGQYPHAIWQNKYKVPFHLAIDTHISETSVFADLILPAATDLETYGLSDARLADGRRVLSLRQPVSQLVDEIFLLRQTKAKNLDLFNAKREPVAESRDFNQIVLELQAVLSGDSVESAQRVISWLENRVSAPPFVIAGINWQKLKQEGLQTYTIPEDEVTLRPSVTVTNFAALDKNLGNSAADSFTLIPYRYQALDNLTANSKYLAELRHDNPVWIHPDRAKQFDIAEGDEVQVASSFGSIAAIAWLTEAIHPKCVAMASGFGHTEMGRVAKAETIAKSDPMTRSLLLHNPIFFSPFTLRLRSWDKVEPVWWHEKGNGVDVRRIFKAVRDDNNAGMTNVDTTIRLRKV